jgi:hypothetical protein
VSPVKYVLSFYIPEDDILHSHCRENLKSYIHPNYQLFNCNYGDWINNVYANSLEMSHCPSEIAASRNPIDLYVSFQWPLLAI